MLRYGLHNIRQLVEKRKHRSRCLLIYDSVPHVALWRALEKLRVLDNLIEMIRSFHCDKLI